jgi:hypothetical protein
VLFLIGRSAWRRLGARGTVRGPLAE